MTKLDATKWQLVSASDSMKATARTQSRLQLYRQPTKAMYAYSRAELPAHMLTCPMQKLGAMSSGLNESMVNNGGYSKTRKGHRDLVTGRYDKVRCSIQKTWLLVSASDSMKATARTQSRLQLYRQPTKVREWNASVVIGAVSMSY
jgi:hypothetical protein